MKKQFRIIFVEHHNLSIAHIRTIANEHNVGMRSSFSGLVQSYSNTKNKKEMQSNGNVCASLCED